MLNNFTKICPKQKNQKPQKPKKRSVKTVDEEPLPEDSVNCLQSLSKLYGSEYRSGDDNILATIHNNLEIIELLKMPIKIGNITTTLLIDSGSACSILIQSLATRVLNSNPLAIWVREIKEPKLRTFSNEPIQFEGKIRTPITSNCCQILAATFTVVANGLKLLIVRDLSNQLGHAVTQSIKQKGNQKNIAPHSAYR